MSSLDFYVFCSMLAPCIDGPEAWMGVVKLIGNGALSKDGFKKPDATGTIVEKAAVKTIPEAEGLLKSPRPSEADGGVQDATIPTVPPSGKSCASRHRESNLSQFQFDKLKSATPQPPPFPNYDGERVTVFGIGTGRSGTVSLAKLLQAQDGSQISHENQPKSLSQGGYGCSKTRIAWGGDFKMAVSNFRQHMRPFCLFHGGFVVGGNDGDCMCA
jgi:hypothetical protein